MGFSGRLYARVEMALTLTCNYGRETQYSVITCVKQHSPSKSCGDDRQVFGASTGQCFHCCAQAVTHSINLAADVCICLAATGHKGIHAARGHHAVWPKRKQQVTQVARLRNLLHEC